MNLMSENRNSNKCCIAVLIKEMREWLKTWANEVDHVSVIVWIALFVKLPAVETIDEQTQGILQRIRATGKTTGLASETCQIMTQFGIITFHRIRICFAIRNLIPAIVIPKPFIRIETITVIPFCLGRIINHELDYFLGSYPDDCPTQNTASFAVYHGQNVDSVFLSPMKVNNSSISASFTSLGIGAAGKAFA